MSPPASQSVKAVSSTLKKHPNPIKAFAASTKTCAVSSTAYGQCILKRYTDVEKGMCEQEFKAFKDCVQKQMGRRW